MKKPNEEVVYEQLHLLLDFINENSPIPQQDLAQTQRLLEEHSEALCSEISQNMSQLRGYELKGYERQINEQLYDVNIYGYQQLITHIRDMPAILSRFNLESTVPEHLMERFPVEAVYEEWMSPEMKNERMDLVMEVTEMFSEKLNDIDDFLKQAYALAKKVDLLVVDEESYISLDLERYHEELYSKMLEHLLVPGVLDKIGEKLAEIKEVMGQSCRNQKAEITNNFYQLQTKTTNPYLRQLLQIFTKTYGEVEALQPSAPSGESYRLEILGQLEELREHILQLLERQQERTFTKKLDDLMEATDFSRLLVLVKSKIFTPEGKEEEDVLEFISMFLGLQKNYIREKLALFERPPAAWSPWEQKTLVAVEEYLERQDGCVEYETD